jgi:hypothetical protein
MHSVTLRIVGIIVVISGVVVIDVSYGWIVVTVVSRNVCGTLRTWRVSTVVS